MTRGLVVRRSLFFIGFLLLWLILSTAHLWPPYLFPSPVQVALSLWKGIQDGTVLIGIVGSMWRAASRAMYSAPRRFV